jgi:hypothetical protein
VKRGDTLWDLAKLYLGDSFLWPEIYRINTDLIDDPHWIYPGEILKLPAPGTTPTVADAPTIKQAGEPAAAPAPAPTPAPAASAVPAASGEPVYEPPIGVLDGPTVFPKQRVDAAVAGRRRGTSNPPTPAVKLGTYLGAPFVDRSGGPRGSGSILQILNLSVAEAASNPKDRAQLNDELLISPPAGSAAPEGERYVTYTIGPSIEGLGQLIIPTGIVQVTRAPRDRDATTVRVIGMFGEIFGDQRLMPYDSTTLQFVSRPQPSSDSLVARVYYVVGTAEFPSLQDYLVINASTDDGVKIGDEFELYVRNHKLEGGDGLLQPDLPVARAQVVRVTRYGTTLMITEHQHPKIEAGTFVRRIATMP